MSEANAPFLKDGMKPPYDQGIRPRTLKLKQDKVLIRVYNESEGALMTGRWMMQPKELEGLSPEDIRDKFALPEIPTHVTEVHLPKGTYLQVGRVASQEGWGSGGAWQYQTLSWLDESTFQPPHSN